MASIDIEGIDDDPRTIENVKVYLHGNTFMSGGLDTMIALQTPDGAHVDLWLDLGEVVRLYWCTSAMIKLLRGDIESLGDFDVPISGGRIPPEIAALMFDR
jgi:hypothetical protein